MALSQTCYAVFSDAIPMLWWEGPPVSGRVVHFWPRDTG
jgi:hypothetical protein